MNENENAILEAIESLRQDLGGRLGNIEQRLGVAEKRQKAQQKDIDTLFQRIDALCEDKPIWKSKDGRETAVLTEDANRVFKKLGYAPRKALRIISESDRLARDGVHFKKLVRTEEYGRIRAVVIVSEVEI